MAKTRITMKSLMIPLVSTPERKPSVSVPNAPKRPQPLLVVRVNQPWQRRLSFSEEDEKNKKEEK